MKPEELFNLERLLIGADVPWTFLIEAIIRILFLYILIIVSMRLMGRRMASTLSRNETAALVSLAAAIGIGMQDPTKGLLPAVVTAGVVIGFQQIIAKVTFKSKSVESLTLGKFHTLVEDGCLRLQFLSHVGLSRELVFAQLRSEGIYNLGQVQRMYIEADGSFTVLEQPEPQPGLPIIPEWDQDFIQEQVKDEEMYVCGSCGALLEEDGTIENDCSTCKHKEWKRAII